MSADNRSNQAQVNSNLSRYIDIFRFQIWYASAMYKHQTELISYGTENWVSQIRWFLLSPTPWKNPVFLTIPQFGISYIIQFHPINQIYPWTGGYSMIIVGYKIPLWFPVHVPHVPTSQSHRPPAPPRSDQKRHRGPHPPSLRPHNWSSRCSHSPTQNHQFMS